jgi:hypothetical protein
MPVWRELVNLSHLPDHVIDRVRRALRGEAFTANVLSDFDNAPRWWSTPDSPMASCRRQEWARRQGASRCAWLRMPASVIFSAMKLPNPLDVNAFPKLVVRMLNLGKWRTRQVCGAS